ncbi:hypothetical protein BK008_11025 [Methanobacterium sp. MZ-A1]|uniref:hypothetical protein n=1 Tax=Methanobacterium sp. MZ-A1 TaxID=1911685 RepID=UPI000C2D46D0|nr:hypothetical protein [Methanobacterium sp. MZ-A1]AUB58789.1 hypothetical protein BK008_11025 [Methanobacterium sp. MZ-A1]
MYEDDEVALIIEELDEYEKRVLRLLGSLNISQHKNIRKETIKKRLPNKYGKKIDRTLDLLRNKGLLFPYRPNNYGLSTLGVIIAQKLVKEFRDQKYDDIKILMLI